MKAIGIIRRIDDLGRIVIPKEIRRTQGIREGDPMELYVEGDSVIFKKYLPEASALHHLDTVRDIIRADMNVGKDALDGLLRQVNDLEDSLKAADKL